MAVSLDTAKFVYAIGGHVTTTRAELEDRNLPRKLGTTCSKMNFGQINRAANGQCPEKSRRKWERDTVRQR